MGVFQEQGFWLYSLTTFSNFDYFITIIFFFFFFFRKLYFTITRRTQSGKIEKIVQLLSFFFLNA